MNNSRIIQTGLANDELWTLLRQLNEQQLQMERLLGRVENVLRGVKLPGGARGRKTAGETNPGARLSALDQTKAVLESAADLREANGNLSAARVAKVFGVSLSQLATWLGRSKQAVSKTPDADSLQKSLSYFERVARLRMITGGDAEFRKWLRTPCEMLNNAQPLELLGKHEWQALADCVEDILTGNPG